MRAEGERVRFVRRGVYPLTHWRERPRLAFAPCLCFPILATQRQESTVTPRQTRPTTRAETA